MTASVYRDHPVRAQISQLLDIQARPEFSEPAISDNEQYAFAREKVHAITSLISLRLKQTPAVLASTAALGGLHGQLQAPLNELNAFVSNKDVSHLLNAAAQLEQNVLPLLWGLPPSNQSEANELTANLLERQSDVANEAIRQVLASKNQLASQLSAAESSISALQNQLTSMTESAAKERAEAAAAVANLQKSYAEKEIERANAFNQEIGTFKDGFAKVQLEASAAAEQKLIDLDGQRARAAQIVQVVGNIGVTGNYQRIANSEARQANVWRLVTLAIFGAGVVVAGATFVKFWDLPVTTENIWSVIVRLLYAIAITAPAWYTARESARHRTNADRARQTELELASIGPFIELMPEEKKNQIKEALTKNYFGNRVDNHEVQTPLDVVQFKDLVVELLKAFKK